MQYLFYLKLTFIVMHQNTNPIYVKTNLGINLIMTELHFMNQISLIKCIIIIINAV